MIKIRSSILWYILLLAATHGEEDHAIELPIVNFGASIKSEDGNPIGGVSVIASDYITSYTVNGRFSKGITGDDGTLQLSFKAIAGVSVIAEKKGYYPSSASPRHQRPVDQQLKFSPFVHSEEDRHSGEGDLTMKKRVNVQASLIMREVQNPIGLIAKHVRVDIPARDVWVGYDLVAGDWLMPYGLGEVADISFRSSPAILDQSPDAQMQTVILEVEFGQGGGFYRIHDNSGWLDVSDLRMPHAAPEKGYITDALKIEQETDHTLSSEADKAKGYFFRCRQETLGDRIISANYGKIPGGFRYLPFERDQPWYGNANNKLRAFGSIEFKYYLNPKPNDRNLEFDTDKNLFGAMNR